MAVGKAQPTTKFQRVMQAIFRSFPGFRQSGLRLLRDGVDVNQIGHHAAEDIARRLIQGSQRIESLRLSAQGQHDASAIFAGIIIGEQHLLAALNGLRRRSGDGLNGQAERDGEPPEPA